MTTPRREKTVYVLGAGFSAGAGAPPQSQLMRRILGLSDAGAHVEEAQRSIRKFLTETLSFRASALDEVSLEDFYTPIDRCLSDGVALRGIGASNLQLLREQMNHLVAVAISQALADHSRSKPGDSVYVQSFAAYLARTAQERRRLAEGAPTATEAKACDPFAVISLNWDILLDNALHEELEVLDRATHRNTMCSEYAPNGVVDYCCYVSSIEEDAPRIRPGLWALGARGYNVKLVKLHGSMNWLQCSNCQRLFVGFGDKFVIQNYRSASKCRHCYRNGNSGLLRGALVMPTFLKDLSNVQIKLVWQNAGVELMEATRLVFIGYSLPASDFEFRQLLSRTVREDATIDVIDFVRMGESGTELAADLARHHELKDRYEQFFGSRTVVADKLGAQAYVTRLIAAQGRDHTGED